jgi:hypothetical protein
VPGPEGPAGAIGPAGPGIAAGGLTGEALVKLTDVDYETTWTPLTGYDDSALVARIAALEAALMPLDVIEGRKYTHHQHAGTG